MNHEKKWDFTEKKGEHKKVSFEWEKGENDGSSAVSSYEISRISEHEMEIVNEILDKGMRPSRSLQEPTIFSDKICSLEAQKVLATF